MSWLNLTGKKNLFLSIILLFFFSLPSIASLLNPGFFQSDDGEWMIIRFSAFHQALVDGQFPVRFLSRLNNEYGYPVANFLYPGFMYLSEIPKLLGFGFVDSIKIILGLSMILSSVFTYLWLSKIFDKWPAFIGSLFYLYTPYHLFDLYKRGSVGEILALAVVPFIFWMIERKDKVLVPLGIALLILSHNTLAVLFFPLIIIYMLIKKTFSLKDLILNIVLGLLISAFFWIPAVFDLQFTVFSQIKVSDWQKYFADPFLIGIPSIFIVIGAFYLRFIERKKDNTSAMFIIFSSLSAFMAYSGSAFLWQVLPASFIQFPFRFLSITILGVSFLVSWYVNKMIGVQKAIVAGLFLAVLFLEFFNSPYRKPEVFFDKGDGYYATNEDTTTVKNEYMPKWVKIIPTERPAKLIELVDGSGEVSTIVATAKEISFTATMEKEGTVRTNKVYFPGWRAKLDGMKAPILYDNEQGVMDLKVGAGSHTISFIFTETPVRFISDLMSLAGLILLVVFARKKL